MPEKKTPKKRQKRFALDTLKHHPFVVPILTFILLFCLSLVGFVNMGAQTIGASDSRIVRLTIGDKEQVLPTRAATVGELLDRLDIRLKDTDVVEPGRDAEIIEDDTRIKVSFSRPVLINDSGKKTLVESADERPKDIARKAGIKVFPEDNIEARPLDLTDTTEAIEAGIAAEQIVIDRATPANLNLYGTPAVVRTRAKTVGQLLSEKKIRTAADDTVTPGIDTPLTPNLQIFVVRVGRQVLSVEEPIAAPVETIDDSNLLAGTTQIRDPGADGKKIITYEVELRNGKEVARKPIQEVLVSGAVRRVVVRGTKVVISNPSENVKIGERLAAERGWAGAEWSCLYQLWQKESKWNHLARNRSSGAYGIPQALPGSKMASAGADWETNPATQITWGLGYIANHPRYRTPCAAWNHSQTFGWY